MALKANGSISTNATLMTEKLTPQMTQTAIRPISIQVGDRVEGEVTVGVAPDMSPVELGAIGAAIRGERYRLFFQLEVPSLDYPPQAIYSGVDIYFERSTSN